MDHSPRFLKLCEDSLKQVKEVSTDEVSSRIAKGDRFELIDVREESEFAAGHLPGAKGIGRGILERDIEKKVPDTSTEIILYCGGGFRSALSAESLKKMGYTNVKSMAGGWREWRAKGLPTA